MLLSYSILWVIGINKFKGAEAIEIGWLLTSTDSIIKIKIKGFIFNITMTQFQFLVDQYLLCNKTTVNYSSFENYHGDTQLFDTMWGVIIITLKIRAT